MKTLVKLCAETGLHPQCLVLEGVERNLIALADGSFGTVYRGKYKGQGIAIKIMKSRPEIDMDELRKVRKALGSILPPPLAKRNHSELRM